MTLYQTVYLLIATTIPIVVLLIIGRHVLSAARSMRLRRFSYAFYSVLAIVGMLILFAGVVAIWFGYGVSHSTKDIKSDLIILAVSTLPIYAVGYGLWRLASFMDAKLSGNSPKQKKGA